LYRNQAWLIFHSGTLPEHPAGIRHSPSLPIPFTLVNISIFNALYNCLSLLFYFIIHFWSSNDSNLSKNRPGLRIADTEKSKRNGLHIFLKYLVWPAMKKDVSRYGIRGHVWKRNWQFITDNEFFKSASFWLTLTLICHGWQIETDVTSFENALPIRCPVCQR